MGENKVDYGIVYTKAKIGQNCYLLFPLDIVEGYSMGSEFLSDPIYKTATSMENIQNSDLLVDTIYSYNDLLRHYEYDDIDFVKEYYLAEAKDYFYYIEITPKEIIKRKLDMHILTSLNPRETYESKNKEPAVTLNNDALSLLLSITSLDSLRQELLRYQNLVGKYKAEEQKKGTTKIVVENGHIVEIQTEHQVKNVPQVTPQVDDTDVKVMPDKKGVSLSGLEKYIKERVFGHDEEIKVIAKTLLMNYRAHPKYGTEPILILGPTGTGKTETIKAASEYLNIPFIEINSANLVPQGIKGPSIEDYLYSLIVSCNYDLDKTERAMVFFDEFDKIGESDLDIKSAVKEIMLKFFEGTTFLIDKPTDDYNFNTRMLNKVYAGAFQNLFDAKKSIGFGGTTTTQPTLNRSRIYEDHYFGKELVTRIPHIITFNPLDRETQKRVILDSKLSVLLRKKQRYEEEFHTKLTATDEYIEAVLDKLASSEKSMRDLNNIIIATLNQVECALLENENHTSEVVLTSETVDDPYKFTLK